MPRPEKVQAVAEIKERLERAQAVFLAEYAGLSVKQQQTLRRGLREGGAEFKVVKMSLARRAAAELKLADLDELFLGPTGIAFTDGDPVTAAKALKEFAKENEALAIKGGLLGDEFLSPERISELADIESREVLLSKIAGVMQAPMANLAGLLAAMPRNLASAMQQLVEKKEEAAGGADADPSDEAAGAADASDEAAGASEAGGDEPPVADPEAAEDKPEEEATGEAVEEAAPEAAVEEEVAPEASEDSAADQEEAAAPQADEDEEAAPAASDEASAEAEVADSPDGEPVADESEADGDDAKSVDEDSAEEAEEA